MSSEWTIEPMQLADLERVLEIEAESHPTSWPRALFVNELALPWATLEVLRCAGRVDAYIDYWMVDEELHVLNIAVAASQRSKGLGSLLLRRAEERAARDGIEYLTLEVRVGNPRAIELYHRLGFRWYGCKRGYYLDTGEDAAYLVKLLAA
ncbi:MAG: ribosomal protein S18-alanine N-acetyltransferase [Myxococcota bacterium]|jgi:ribosomal-protein-alanine N-acetyltransferase|nr:ribosomal protein S18-alanine N-acetyltransferase [Myxococcota bacterium]